MAEFFDMGGYGGFVWVAFGFTLLALLGLFFQSLWLMRKREAELESMRDRPEGRRRVSRPRVVKAGSEPEEGSSSSDAE